MAKMRTPLYMSSTHVHVHFEIINNSSLHRVDNICYGWTDMTLWLSPLGISLITRLKKNGFLDEPEMTTYDYNHHNHDDWSNILR